MKQIILLAVSLMSVGCYGFNCKDTLTCDCTLDCPDDHECKVRYEIDQKVEPDEANQVCVLKSDIDCLDNSECPINAVCINNLCEEELCIEECNSSQECIVYPDTNSLKCL